MPLYTIEDAKGNRAEIYRTIARRDCLPQGWRRVFTPTRAYLAGAIEEESPEGAVPRAFKEIEQAGTPWRQITKETGFSRDELRRVWNF